MNNFNDRGFTYPILGNIKFIDNPRNVINAILMPTDNINLSIRSILSSFKISIIKKPGNTVIKTNPIICLAIGTSRNTDVSSKNKKQTINIDNLYLI